MAITKSSFPETLFVRVDDNCDDELFLANVEIDACADIGEATLVGRYRLIDVVTVTGTVIIKEDK